jgi:FRG domain
MRTAYRGHQLGSVQILCEWARTSPFHISRAAAALRLRTGFHRTGRADLIRFLTQDIPTLHRHLSQRTAHIFNLTIADENGAFFNLVQHHGYPTPLLDWTYSPYVGAFFAYQKVQNSEARKATDNDKVRIFMFDQREWRGAYIQLPKVTSCPPHFSIQEFISIENERLIPQQSISSITNIDDIETYIRSKETPERRYLHVIDLPLSERPHVMRELSTMGITAGSLFPGLDGACEELKGTQFRPVAAGFPKRAQCVIFSWCWRTG